MNLILRHIFLMSLFILITGCSHTDNNPQKTTITFWHFWSEPIQKEALQSLIDQYESEHPTIDIITNELQWTDGKTKLLLAFSSNQVPDIIHIGLEWVPEFIQAEVLHELTVDSSYNIPKQLLPALKDASGKFYAIPWTMNTRALILTHQLSQNTLSDTVSIETLSALIHNQKLWGVNAHEPHTLLKKVLPIIWSKGSSLCRSLPFSATFDKDAIQGLNAYLQLVKHGKIDQSRQLDMYLTKGTIQAFITGQWIIPSLKDIPHTVMPRIPGVSGASILSGDCFAITKQSANVIEANKFLQFLNSYSNSKKFCLKIADAGIPASNLVWNDSSFKENPDISAFTALCSRSIVLPSPPYFLDAEKILEESIMKAVYGTMSPELALSEAKSLLKALEDKYNDQSNNP